MSTNTAQRIFSLILLTGLLLSLTYPGGVQATPQVKAIPASIALEDPLAKIEAQVLDELTAQGSTDYFIVMKEQADLEAAASLTTKAQKGEFVFNSLRATADRTQADLRATLDQQGVDYRAFYIANTLLVRGGTRELLMAVASRPDVARVTANHQYQLELPEIQPAILAPAGVESNIAFVNADDAWALGVTGQGIVLASNITGLDWNHPALQSHYRGWNGVSPDHNYNWWDATGTYPNEPNDSVGYGSYITGVMVGDDGAGNQIGMAPGAKTIHCKNMTNGALTNDIFILTCHEWDLAPWDLTGNNPRPHLAPDVIYSTFFGSGGNNPVYRNAIDNLISAGIFYVAPAGDSGPGCSTLTSPGDYQEVLTTASLYHQGSVLPGILDEWSGRGPSLLDGGYFPDIMAPGGDLIRSSYHEDGYGYGNGDVTAGGHSTGLVGLLWSANPFLRGQVEDTMQIIKNTAVPLAGQEGYGCGGDYTTGPNNDWGYGTIDALAAVQAAMAYGGTEGTLQGTVIDSVSSEPIPGADILATLNPAQTFQLFTELSGEYSLNVIAGSYTVDAAAFGYQSEQVTGVEVGDGETITQDFDLVPLPTHVISVTVVDANAGWPLYAQARLLDTPLVPVWNDPLTGHFELSVPEGTYILAVDVWTPGYLHQEVAVGPVMEDIELIVQVEPDVIACTAPGYEYSATPVLLEDFETSDGGFTVSGDLPSWEWGEPTYGPGTAHSGVNVWATGLISGTYHDNENSYLTSPPIDLSSQAGKVIQLDWWQWLQTENGYDFADLQASKDSGASWSTVYGPVSGDVNLSWGHQLVRIEPSYAVDDFQVRFHINPDYLGTLPGWYLDDVGVQAGECMPMPGGLVVGIVFDANTGLALQSATVENDSGFSTWTAHTDDPNIADGFYVLFSPEGSHDFTASLESYGPDVESVDVTSGEATWQDLHLSAGLLSFDPLNLSASLELGSNTTALLTIANIGVSTASYAISESENGFDPVLINSARTLSLPATPADPPVGSAVAAGRGYRARAAQAIPVPASLTAGPDVFIVCADDYPCEPIASMLMAFGDIGSVTSYDARLSTPTLEQLLAYDIVLTWSNYGYSNAEKFGDVLADYVDAGGKVIDLMFSQAPYGVEGRFFDEDYTAFKGLGTLFSWDCLGGYDPAHPIMDSITDVCDLFRLGGTYLTPGSTSVANWSDGEIFVAVKDNRSVVSINMYVGAYYAWAGQGDAVVHNAVLWLADQDVPWLSEDPITGTLEAGTGFQEVTVTFDAGVPEVTQPGSYHAWIKIKSDTPYNPTILPITMTVTAPQAYGKLEGTVQSLGYCDADPAPLNEAVVSIESGTGMTWRVDTDETGHYQVWMDAANSPLTVTVTANEHAPGLAAGVVIEPNGAVTSQEFDLRWLVPCVSAVPAALDADVPLGYARTVALEIANQGGSDTGFELSENVSWLVEDPITGTVASESSLVVEVTFTTLPTMTVGDVYATTLVLFSEDPDHPEIDILVTMHVVEYVNYMPLIWKKE